MDDTIPPLQRPEDAPPIVTDHDLYLRWRSLMGELGFARRRFWLAFIDPDGMMIPHITQIDDVPARTDPGFCSELIHVLDHLNCGEVGGLSATILYSRPGRHPMSEDDRSWARALTEAASRAGVRLWPVHFANDAELTVFAPDDLDRSRAS